MTPEEIHKELSRAAAIITSRHEELRETSRPDPVDACLIGSVLISMKLSFTRRGAYTQWIHDYLPFSARTARRYTQRLRDHLELEQGLDWELILEDLKDLRDFAARRAAAAQGEV